LSQYVLATRSFGAELVPQAEIPSRIYGHVCDLHRWVAARARGMSEAQTAAFMLRAFLVAGIERSGCG